ncbi:MAG TPA: hypothetical protein DEQ72_00240 [Lachnospiraceae bacterium]|jgi:hypothetical protein|nr:hypothetical protein [Lachnospiraceae bacterium]
MPGAVTERLLFAAKEVVTRSLYAFVFYSPKGIKTKAFFVAATGKEFGLSDIHRARTNSIFLQKNSGQVAHALPC